MPPDASSNRVTLPVAATQLSAEAAGIQPQRIAVIVTRQIGDVLLTTPLLEAIDARWPAAAIEAIGLAGTLGMLEHNPMVAARVEIGRRLSWPERRALLRRIWRRYDLAFIAEGSDRAHLLGWLAAPLRAGLVPEERSHAWWKRLLLAHAVTVSGDRSQRHVAAEKLMLMTPWRVASTSASASVSASGSYRIVPPPPRTLPPDLAGALGAAPVVVHVPSMWRYKQWPVAHYARVVEALLAAGHQVVLTGGPGEADRAKVEPLKGLGAPPQLLDACGRLDLNQIAALLARAALYIGPDTSVTHLAAAVGVPVIALFGPTNPARWGPVSEVSELTESLMTPPTAARNKVIVLQGSNACVPCGRAGCEDHRDSRSDCLEQGLPPERVIAQARRQLSSASV